MQVRLGYSQALGGLVLAISYCNSQSLLEEEIDALLSCQNCDHNDTHYHDF